MPLRRNPFCAKLAFDFDLAESFALEVRELEILEHEIDELVEA